MSPIISKHWLELDISGNKGGTRVVRGVIQNEKVVNVLKNTAERYLLPSAGWTSGCRKAAREGKTVVKFTKQNPRNVQEKQMNSQNVGNMKQQPPEYSSCLFNWQSWTLAKVVTWFIALTLPVLKGMEYTNVPGTCSAALLYHRGKWSALNTPSLSSAVRKSLRKGRERSWVIKDCIHQAWWRLWVMIRETMSGGTHWLESWSAGMNRLVLDRPVRVPRKVISTPLSEFLLIWKILVCIFCVGGIGKGRLASNCNKSVQNLAWTLVFNVKVQWTMYSDSFLSIKVLNFWAIMRQYSVFLNISTITDWQFFFKKSS